MTDATLTLIVLAATVGLFVWNRLSVSLVAVLCALTLYALGLVDAPTTIAGLGDSIIIFIACLFVLAGALESSGVTAWAGRAIVQRGGTGRGRLLVALMGLAALMAALVTPNGAAAALLPIVVVAARRSEQQPSRLLMPVAFAASAGALLILSGSPVNVIVSDALLEATGSRFGFFEFAIIGIPLVLVTIAITVLVGPRLIPDVEPGELPADLEGHLSVLLSHYRLERGFYRLRARKSSPLVGRSVTDLVLADGVSLIGVQHANGVPALVEDVIGARDVLVVTGESDQVAAIVEPLGLQVVASPLTRATREALLGRDAGITEVVVAPRSSLVGQRVFLGQVRSDLTVLGIRRLGRQRDAGPTVLEEGDLLLLHGPWAAVQRLAGDTDVLVVNDPDLVRQQNVPLGPAAWRAIGVLAVTIALLATGITTPAIAGLIGACGIVLLKVLTPTQVYRAISWQTLVLIGGLIPLSAAISTSGLADQIAGVLVGLVAGGSPLLLLAALFLLTLVLGQVVSNTATVLVVAPIALAAANDVGMAPEPVLMLVAVAGAAAFFTPIATPANMIVMGPAGYRFGDYWKLGSVVAVAWFVIAMVLIPLVWPL